MGSVRVLMVDDDKEFCKTVESFAKKRGVFLVTKNDLAQMKEYLREYVLSLSAVILDVRCKKDLAQGEPKPDFLFAALSELDAHYQYLPRFVLTGDSDNVSQWKELFGKESFFLKTLEELNRLFEEIALIAKDSDLIRIKNEFSDMISISERYLPSHSQEELLKLLMARRSKGWSDVKAGLGFIRNVLEKIFEILIQNGKIPGKYHNGKDLLFRKMHTYLGGRYDSGQSRYVEINDKSYHGAIQVESNMLYSISSDHGTHNTVGTFKPSENTMHSAVFALRDVMTWFDLRMRDAIETK